MTRDELKQLIVGSFATVPTAFNEDYELDLGVMTELTHWWIANGLVTGKAVIKVAAAMGEGPDLSDEEWPHLLSTVVRAADGRVPVICGLKTKNTLHTIEDIKQAQDLGAIAVQVLLPIFHHPNQDDLVRYFSDISAAVDIGILIYNTFWFGCESITADTMLRLVDAEHVVAIKWDVPEGEKYDDMRKFAHVFNVIDNAEQPVRCHRNGGRGYISSTVHAYPQHDLLIWELLEAGQYDQARILYERTSKPLRAFFAKASQRSGGYRVTKAMMEVMGHPVGPPRPPTLPLDNHEMGELRDLLVSFGWSAPTNERLP